MENHPLTILVLCIDSIGRFNASFGLTFKLQKRGHRVIYLATQRYQRKLTSHGFEVIISENGNAQADEENLGETLAKSLLDNGIIGPASTMEKVEHCLQLFMQSPQAVQRMIGLSQDFEKAIKQCHPDLVIIDHLFLPPSVYYSNIPWISFVSANPLSEVFPPDNELPPGCSGYPTNGSNKSDWPDFNKIRQGFFHSKEFNDYVEKLGHERYPKDVVKPQTQMMTVYACPEELNYPEIRAKGWYNLEVFNKHDPTNAIDINRLIPKKFLNDNLNGNFSGKWIYLSLGSMCSIDVPLMKRLVGILSTTKHKYIVSKGPCHAEYELAANMWGDRYVPQIQIIKFVDLVITHGGNNSTTEIFAQGKPMIVLPMFFDQYDNAQRLHELAYGIRLDPYRFTKEELLDAITRLLYDHELKRKLQKAAHRIQSSSADEEICVQIENKLCKSN